MSEITTGTPLTPADADRLLTYVADLELEVDRLRRQGRFMEKKAAESLSRIVRLCNEPAPSDPLPVLAEVNATARHLAEIVRDLHDSSGYHPTLDQVVAVAIRPLVEQIFRWQRRLAAASSAELRLELEIDHVEWFPVRLRHILDNLIANAFRCRDASTSEKLIRFALQSRDGAYEIRVTSNGVAPPFGSDRQTLGLLLRPATGGDSGAGIGLAVVRLLAEQSGGSVSHVVHPDSQTDFIVTLPRYDLLDYLE